MQLYGPMNRKRREKRHNKKVDNGTKGDGKLRRDTNLWKNYLDFSSSFRDSWKVQVQTLYGLDMADKEEILLSYFPGLPCFPYPLLILPFPFKAHHLHSLLRLYHLLKIPFVGWLEALSCIFLILEPCLTEKPPSETFVAMIEWTWWFVLLLIVYAWKWFTFHCHSLNPASKKWRGQSYKLPEWELGIFANTNDCQRPWLLIHFNINLA